MQLSTQNNRHLDRFGRPYLFALPNVKLQNYIDDDVAKIFAVDDDSPTTTSSSSSTSWWSQTLHPTIRRVRDQILVLAQTPAANHDDDHRDSSPTTSLYPRHWILQTNQSTAANHPTHRQIEKNPSSGNPHGHTTTTTTTTTPASKTAFAVAQFNTLAKGLSSGPSSLVPTPFPPIANEDDAARTTSYGGFTSLLRPDIVLDFDRVRKWRLLETVLGGGIAVEGRDGDDDSDDGSRRHPFPAFDIVALQEVDEFHSFFEPILIGNNHHRDEDHDPKKDDDDDAKTKDDDRSSPSSHPRHYRGVFQPKPNSPCVRWGWYSDGVALLWNADKFRTVSRCQSPTTTTMTTTTTSEATTSSTGTTTNSDDAMPGKESTPLQHCDPWIEIGAFSNNDDDLPVQNQVYVIVPLQIIPSSSSSSSIRDNIVVVATTHLKAKEGTENERIRTSQALELRRKVENVANELRTLGWEDVSIILLGDWNAEPEDASVRSILERRGNGGLEMDNDVGIGDKGMKWDFHSAYPLDDENGDDENNHFYTTWKTRKDGTKRRVIDYIFYSSARSNDGNGRRGALVTGADEVGLSCTHTLSVPKDEEVEATRLPGLRYPSDHLLIAAKFEI